MELGCAAKVATAAGSRCPFGRSGLIGSRSTARLKKKFRGGRSNRLAWLSIVRLSEGYGSLCALGDQVGDGVRERTQAQRGRLAAAVAGIAEGTNVASMQAQGEEVDDDVAAAEVMQWSTSELLRIRLSCFLPFAALLLHQTQTLLPPSPPAGQLTGRPVG